MMDIIFGITEADYNRFVDKVNSGKLEEGDYFGRVYCGERILELIITDYEDDHTPEFRAYQLTTDYFSSVDETSVSGLYYKELDYAPVMDFIPSNYADFKRGITRWINREWKLDKEAESKTNVTPWIQPCDTFELWFRIGGRLKLTGREYFKILDGDKDILIEKIKRIGCDVFTPDGDCYAPDGEYHGITVDQNKFTVEV